MNNSTLYGNSAANGGGILNAGTLTMKSTLLAGQTSGGSCDLSGGTATSDGYNLDDDGSCALTATGDQSDVTNAGSYLGPLQNNGGPTPTIAMVTGSSAIDATPVNECTDAFGSPVSTDQRGITRPQGKGCDIGAFEVVAPVPTANICTGAIVTDCSTTITLDYYVPSSAILNSTTPVTVVAQGTPGLDFTLDIADTTCTSGLAGPGPLRRGGHLHPHRARIAPGRSHPH